MMLAEIIYTNDTKDELEYEYESVNQLGFKVLVNVTWPYVAEKVEINPDYIKAVIVDKEESEE